MKYTPSIRALIFISGLFFSLFGLAQDLTSQNIFGETVDDFLPVEKAYTVAPSKTSNTVEFSWRIEDGYYLYRHQFTLVAKSASKTQALPFTIPDGKRKYDEIFEKEVEVYYHSAILSATLPTWDESYELQLSSQGCADAGLCYPPRTQFFSIEGNILLETDESTITSAAQSASVASTNIAQTSQPNGEQPLLIFILLGALIGGMILNLMPCVFPVLSLKALSLASGSASKHRINGWAYTAGVVLSFVAVAFIIIAAKSAGTTLGWGFQLQQPAFVAALFYLFFLLGMNLFGLFEVGTSWMGIGNKLTQGTGTTSSFFTGVLAAVVASPCTAPFMATAIGFTISQSAVVALLVFIFLGFGMALPYLALSHSPRIAAKLPKPGAWMETFKQFLAFPLFFTCVWLLVVLGEQTNADASAMLVGGAIALAMALWLLKKQPSNTWKWLYRLAAFVLAASAINLAVDIKKIGVHDDEIWQDYSPELLFELREQNRAVFIDLTADWCITCKINERIALDVDKVTSFAETNNIAMLRGDWTLSDPKITTLLREFNRNGVPLYLMYPTHSQGAPKVLPQILTTGTVLDAMQEAIK